MDDVNKKTLLEKRQVYIQERNADRQELLRLRHSIAAATEWIESIDKILTLCGDAEKKSPLITPKSTDKSFLGVIRSTIKSSDTALSMNDILELLKAVDYDFGQGKDPKRKITSALSLLKSKDELVLDYAEGRTNFYKFKKEKEDKMT